MTPQEIIADMLNMRREHARLRRRTIGFVAYFFAIALIFSVEVAMRVPLWMTDCAVALVQIAMMCSAWDGFNQVDAEFRRLEEAVKRHEADPNK